ncbi:hypothetical protein DL771_002522 [Monosporascus sp. 5C6A]|nr:hypothetical protein DL771_002522 [Monosporascus sp. 5C6A]
MSVNGGPHADAAQTDTLVAEAATLAIIVYTTVCPINQATLVIAGLHGGDLRCAEEDHEDHCGRPSGYSSRGIFRSVNAADIFDRQNRYHGRRLNEWY